MTTALSFALALKQADIGIAMDEMGTKVAKAAPAQGISGKEFPIRRVPSGDFRKSNYPRNA